MSEFASPEEELEHIRFQRDSYLADLQRVEKERDEYRTSLDSVPPDSTVERGSDGEADQVEPSGPSHEELTAERDAYLGDLQRVTAEFANYRRQVDKRSADASQKGALELVEKLLPVLDACDAALANGADAVEPIRSVLVQTLEKEGLASVGEIGDLFDPTVHEAVLREERPDGEEGGDEQVVGEVMRAGYRWRDHVVRAAMVKVLG